MRRVGAAMAVAALLTGCGGDGDGTTGGTAITGQPTDSSASPAPSQTPSKSVTAASVLDGLKAAIPTITKTIVYTAENDPNSRLGRPGQYTSKAGFHDSRVPAREVEFEGEPFAVRRGGDIEVFPDEGGAKERAEYIDGLVNRSGGIPGLQPEYIYRRGKVLLRVSGALTPAVAGEYEKVLASVVG